MKVNKADLQTWREAIAPLDTAERRRRYIAGDFPRAELVKDLDMRYRWDLFHLAPDDNDEIIGGIYATGYNDAHIDTALRAIVPALDR